MKQFFTITFLLFYFSIFSQESTFDISKEDKKFTVHSIKFSINSSEELKTINWNDTKETFKGNKPEDLIELAFEIDLPKSKNKFKSSYKISGKTKNIDSLIKKIEKGVTSISKIISNYK